MKKRFSTIILLLALVLTMSVLGCKGIDDLGGDAGKWQDLNPLNDKGLVRCIQLHADNEQIDWWVVTDSNKILLEPNKDYYYVNSNGKPFSDGIKEGEPIPKGESVYLQFEKAEDVIVWIHQENVAAKNEQKGAKDFRGTVNVQSAQGFRVDASDYREVVSQVGIVKVTCNEGAGTGNGKWSGDYRITEIWPLTNKDGPQWEAAEGLKYKLGNDGAIKMGESKRFIFPAGDSIIALKQPDRFNENSTNQEELTAMVTQEDWYWCAAFYDNIDDSKILDTDASDLTVTYYGPVKAHTENPALSSQCGAYFILGNETLYKSALGSVYTINDSDIVDGADIK